jgi:hypothetical protein
MRLFLSDTTCDEFLIIQSDNEPQFVTFVRDVIFRELGDLAKIARLIHWREIAPTMPGGNGWRTQQVLKLMVSHVASNQIILILDSKNHFVTPTAFGTFVDGSGKLRTHYASHWGHMQPFFEASFSYWSVRTRPYIGACVPTITPFAYFRSFVVKMISEIEKREGRSLPEYFLETENQSTEFFLLAAYLIRETGNFESQYHFGSPLAAIIFKNNVADDHVTQIIRDLRMQHIPTFGLHWAAVPHLNESQRREIKHLWTSLALSTPAKADRVLAECGRVYGPD